MVDLALMGHLEDASFILAVGLGVMIFNFVYWSFGFLRMGVTGLTAQSVGERNIHESHLILFRGLFIATIIACFLLLIQDYLLQLSLYLIEGDQVVNQQVSSYFKTRIWAAPATLGQYVFLGWFFGKQNANFPMIITIAINGLNILLSYYFVNYWGIEVKGVALGTTLSQYIGLLISILLFLVYYAKEVHQVHFQDVLQWSSIQQFLRINGDIFIRTLCLIFTFSFFKIQSLQGGTIIGAANMLLLELITLSSYGIDGFAQAAQAVCGKYYGAKDSNRFKKVVYYSFYWGLGFAMIYVLSYFCFGPSILQLLTDQLPVIDEALIYLPWLVMFPIICAIPFVWDGIFIGVTASRGIRNTMLWATFLVFLPVYYISQGTIGNHGLWLALLLFMAARGVIQSFMAKRQVFYWLKG